MTAPTDPSQTTVLPQEDGIDQSKSLKAMFRCLGKKNELRIKNVSDTDGFQKGYIASLLFNA